jgi:hypothetical protein
MNRHMGTLFLHRGHFQCWPGPAWCPYYLSIWYKSHHHAKLRLGATSDWVHFIIIPIESVQKHSTLNGSHKDATPTWYMLGFTAHGSHCSLLLESLLVSGFSLSMCYRLWLGKPTPFILIAGRLHTYIMCFLTCYSGYRSYGCNPILIFRGLLQVRSLICLCPCPLPLVHHAVGYDWGIPPISYSYS